MSTLSPVIYQLPTPLPATVGISPNFKAMVCGNDLETITTAGYLNQVDLQSNPVGSTDVLQILYNFNPQTQVGIYGSFTVSITNGIITLNPTVSSGEVVLPVQDGHFANFIGTTGAIGDLNLHPSNTANQIVPTVDETDGVLDGFVPSFIGTDGSIGLQTDSSFYKFNGDVYAGDNATSIGGSCVSSSGIPEGASFFFTASANDGGFASELLSAETLTHNAFYFMPDPIVGFSTVAVFQSNPSVITPGNILVAGPSNGIISDGGSPQSGFVLTSGTSDMQPGSFVKYDTETDTISGSSVTINTQSGRIQTNDLTTPSGGVYTFTLNNSLISAATSIILLQLQYGTNTKHSIECTLLSIPSPGSCEISLINNNSTAMDGNMIIDFFLVC